MRKTFLTLLALFSFLSMPVLAQASTTEAGFPLEGDWQGTISTPQGDLPVIFHITRNDDDSFAATLDSPAQEAYGIPMDSVEVDGHNIRIWSQALQGGFTTEVNDEKPDEMVGTWEQMGHTLPLTITRVVEESSD